MKFSKILVVEDDPTIRLFVVQALACAGYEAQEAQDCDTAWRLFTDAAFDIVITDINLPDGSGLDLCRRMKTSAPSTRILLMTGHLLPGLPVEGVRLGADYYLNKPFEMSELLCAVEMLADASALQSQVRVDSMRPGWCEFLITSSEDSVIRLQSFLDAILKDHVASERFWEVRLAIMELALNAVEWGNKNDASQSVLISVGVIESGVIVKIQDQGDGFDVQAVMELAERMEPSELQRLRECEGKRPGGLGINLIRQVADKLFFNERANMAVLYFSRE